MSANSSNKPDTELPAAPPRPRSRWWLAFALPFWVLAGFGLAQVLLVGVLYGLRFMGVSFAGINEAIFNAVIAASVYVLSLAIVLALPWWLKKYRTTKQDIGLTRLPSWLDIGLAPAGFVVYLIGSTILITVVGMLVPSLDLQQIQETGFNDLAHQYEYVLAFITLVVLAPVAEEVLFRGYLYGKLRGAVPVWLAVLIVSVLFGAVHGQWNVALDVFALSIVLCSLREITGSIWAGVLLHMLKNSLAFYLLFVNPTLLSTMGG